MNDFENRNKIVIDVYNEPSDGVEIVTRTWGSLCVLMGDIGDVLAGKVWRHFRNDSLSLRGRLPYHLVSIAMQLRDMAYTFLLQGNRKFWGGGMSFDGTDLVRLRILFDRMEQLFFQARKTLINLESEMTKTNSSQPSPEGKGDS